MVIASWFTMKPLPLKQVDVCGWEGSLAQLMRDKFIAHINITMSNTATYPTSFPESGKEHSTQDIYPAATEDSEAGCTKLDELKTSLKEQVDERSWVDLAAGLAIGIGVGYLLFHQRSPSSLREIFSESVSPWASRNIHNAVDSFRNSKPVNSISEGISRLRAS